MSLVCFRVTIKTSDSPFKTRFRLSDNGINVMRAVGSVTMASMHCITCKGSTHIKAIIIMIHVLHMLVEIFSHKEKLSSNLDFIYLFFW